ncbi:MAG: hypothetical protein WB626_01930 [Bacteroidota bacterium]
MVEPPPAAQTPAPDGPRGQLTPPAAEELGYYYHGFLRALALYRRAAFTGWAVAAAGAAGVPLVWAGGRFHGAADLVLSAACLAAGLLLVASAVSFLTSYLAVSFPCVPREGSSGGDHPAVAELRRIMKDVEEGGWHEARRAIREVREVGERFALPAQP